jgi:hypothetical protein
MALKRWISIQQYTTVTKPSLWRFYFVPLKQETFSIVHYIRLSLKKVGQSWPWSYGSWIYNYLCNQCLSPLMLWVRFLIRARCTTLCDQVCQWLATGQWFFWPYRVKT